MAKKKLSCGYDGTTDEIMVALYHTPKEKDGYTTTQEHFTAAVCWYTPDTNEFLAHDVMCSDGLSQREAIDALREKYAADMPTKESFRENKRHDIKVGRLFFINYPKEMLESEISFIRSEADRHNQSVNTETRNKANKEELLAALALELDGVVDDWDRYIQFFPDEVLIYGIRKFNRNIGHRETVIRDHRYKRRTNGTYNIDKIKEAVIEVAGYTKYRDRRNNVEKENGDAADCLRESLGLKYGVATVNTETKRATLKITVDLNKVEALIEMLDKNWGTNLKEAK